MWGCLSAVPEPDYFQIFHLELFGEMQRITHEQKVPEFKCEYLILTENPITAKVYIIDSKEFGQKYIAC